MVEDSVFSPQNAAHRIAGGWWSKQKDIGMTLKKDFNFTALVTGAFFVRNMVLFIILAVLLLLFVFPRLQ